MNSKKVGYVIPLLGVIFFVTMGMGIIIGRTALLESPWHVFGYALASLLFGALVGFSEILSRYRDEPLQASITASGLAYLFLNGIISLAAFVLLRKYADNIFPGIKDDLLITAFVAGFGGMAVFRSKLFTFRSPDGHEYAIGPAIVLETVLKTIDQKIDRRRATERQGRVYEQMADLADFENTARYIKACLPSFQNLTQEEKREIQTVIEDYEKIDWPDSLKCLALGFAYLNIAGEENFNQVVGNLRKFLSETESQGAANISGPPAPATPAAPKVPPASSKSKTPQR